MDPNMTLLCSALESVLLTLESDETNAQAWADARNALRHYGVGEADDEELWLAVECEDRDALRTIVSGWVSGERLLLERDRAVLKRAMKAYRKRLKITLLDAESSVAGGPMSAGRTSDIVGIVPPDRYPREVWDHLVRQKRLVADRGNTYELPPGG
jgi:hypothetical protein